MYLRGPHSVHQYTLSNSFRVTNSYSYAHALSALSLAFALSRSRLKSTSTLATVVFSRLSSKLALAFQNFSSFTLPRRFALTALLRNCQGTLTRLFCNRSAKNWDCVASLYVARACRARFRSVATASLVTVVVTALFVRTAKLISRSFVVSSIFFVL